jgi:uncharacterized protein (TIGR03083 family)
MVGQAGRWPPGAVPGGWEAAMTGGRELAGLDPFALLDGEAERLDGFFCGLGESGWARASRCAGWTVRDVLGHLTHGEDYHRACLDGTVAAFFARFAGRGGTDLDSANALGVAGYAALSPGEALARWRAASAGNRRRFRGRGGGVVGTSVGDYPCRWQAFHVAAELATHADDIGVGAAGGEQGTRTAWRARYSRFALAEAKPHLTIHAAGARTLVTDGPDTADVGDHELAEAVMGRRDEASRLTAELRELLSIMP